MNKCTCMSWQIHQKGVPADDLTPAKCLETASEQRAGGGSELVNNMKFETNHYKLARHYQNTTFISPPSYHCTSSRNGRGSTWNRRGALDGGVPMLRVEF